MALQTFRDLLARRPFHPFRITMSRGESFEVRHPETALATRSDLLIGVDDSGDGVPASFRICSPSHIMAVEPVAVGA